MDSFNYVKGFDLLGVKARQIPCLTAKGEPSNELALKIGLLYINEDNGDMYKCIKGNGEEGLVWVLVNNESNDSGWNASGLSATAVTLLISILRNGRYTTNQSTNITALEAALASSGGSEGGEDYPEVPDVPDGPDTGVAITQSGSTLILTGVPTITSITQSSSILALV